jgi:hypothetical protein
MCYYILKLILNSGSELMTICWFLTFFINCDWGKWCCIFFACAQWCYLPFEDYFDRRPLIIQTTWNRVSIQKFARYIYCCLRSTLFTNRFARSMCLMLRACEKVKHNPTCLKWNPSAHFWQVEACEEHGTSRSSWTNASTHERINWISHTWPGDYRCDASQYPHWRLRRPFTYNSWEIYDFHEQYVHERQDLAVKS